MENANNVLVEKLKWNRTLGKRRCIHEYNTKMYLNELERKGVGSISKTTIDS